MSHDGVREGGNPHEAARFRTTRWSMVLRAGADAAESRPALEALCRQYWQPLYTFVRRKGHVPEEAQDLTQAFFERLLENRSLALADPLRGRFRSFLMSSMQRFLADDHDRRNRLKRGGGVRFLEIDGLDAEARYACEPATDVTPERAFEQRWVVTLLERVLGRIEAEVRAEGMGERFEALRGFLVEDRGGVAFAEMATRLNMTEAAVKGVVRRLRARYRELLREEVGQTVEDPADVDAEIRYLLSLFAQ